MEDSQDFTRQLTDATMDPEEGHGDPLGEQPPMPDLIDLSEVLAQLSKLDDRRQPEVRLLSVDEVAKYVEPVFSEHHALLPDWASSFFVGHVDETGKVLGFITVQSVLHVEPMWIKPGHSQLLPHIISVAVEEIGRVMQHNVKVYLTADNERVVNLCERLGMSREPGTPMTKWIRQEQPPAELPESLTETPDEATTNEGSE